LPVGVLSAAVGEEESSATVTLTYVSLEPPLVAVPLRAGSRTRGLAEASGAFKLAILSESQAELAVRPVEPPEAECVAVYSCVVENADGPLVVGRVVASVTNDREPLLRFRRRYRGLGDAVDVEREADYPL
jgi:flavin reductase (DIM6/NTAB) family NADH-FMN oxidoreductase RutF